MNKDYYQILGVPRTADEKEIKRAFRKLAKKYHPDTNAGNVNAEKRFKDINEAYAVLGDSKKKDLYDRYGEMGLQEGFDPKAYEAYQAYQRGNGSSGWSDAGGSGGFHSVHFEGYDGDMEDLLSGLFGHGRRGSREYGTAGTASGFDGHFGGFGSYAGNGAGRGRRGADLTSKIDISFDEAVRGCDRMFTLTDPAGGKTSLQVHIPAGIDEGQKVRLKGKGNPGANGAPDGDLYLEVHILPREGVERKGQDVYVTVKIPYTTAVLGGEAMVPTLDGQVICTIRPGTQPGSRIRLRGKGIVSMKNPSVRGDEYVVIQIEVPKDLTADQKQKLEDYAQARGEGNGWKKGRAA